MNTAKDHYDQQLASVYSWMAGTPEAAIRRNHDLFRQLEIDLTPRGLAIDLGAGSGFQSIPLAELGFSVIAVDFCAALLSELSDGAKHLPIRTVHDDVLNFSKYVDQQAQVIVCMGDTLTHLESLSSVQSLLLSVERALVKGGKLVLTFRDYVSVEPKGIRLCRKNKWVVRWESLKPRTPHSQCPLHLYSNGGTFCLKSSCSMFVGIAVIP